MNTNKALKSGRGPDSAVSQHDVVIDLTTPQTTTEPLERTDWIDRCTRIGIAAIFFVNGFVAFVTPGAFRSVLEANPIASLLPGFILDPMVFLAGVNDLLLGCAIIWGRDRRMVWAWMALWLATIAGVKFLNLMG